MVNKMKLQPLPSRTSFIGVGGNNLGNALGEVTLKILLPHSSKEGIIAKFFVLKNITNYVPPARKPEWNKNQLYLADETYNEPGKIDALLGLEIWIQIVKSHIIRARNKLAIAQNTKLGYVIFEAENPYKIEEPYIGSIVQQESTDELLEQIRKMWELEKIDTQRFLTSEEKLCEEIFATTHTRTNTGRYMVKIPFKENLQKLGRSKNLALKQFFAMETRMRNNKELNDKYKAFMSEYLTLGHMEQIYETEESGYYTPHHAVFSANKFRTVFNASAKTSTGITLNETQMVGERLQLELFFILLNFRRHKFGITADIEKMYRQILIHKDHRKYQKILWREDEKKPVKVFQLRTVTYGHACAPHCAVRALIQCANDNFSQFPLGAEIVKNCFYVDDLLTGADTPFEVNKIQQEVTQLLKKGGFNITKWQGNEKTHEVIELKDEEVKSVLGLYWNVDRDEFSFKLKREDEEVVNWTKRKILSKISRLYDPIGFLGPVIIRGKIIIQELWKDKLDWDEELSPSIQERWQMYNDELKLVKDIVVKRWLGSTKSSSIQLHGFCDASETGYGAVIYTRIKIAKGKYITSLLTSKSRVAPLKITTIPRLELCSANLLCDLMFTIKPSFVHQPNKIFLWSDSRIVLCWCKKSPVTMKVFVANRIANIQEKTDELKADWKWVSGKENPADLISRGTTVKELKQNNLWWKGPKWLSQPSNEWPNCELKENQVKEILEQQEMKKIHLVQTKNINQKELIIYPWFKYSSKTQKPFPLIKAYGEWAKLVRVTATILRSWRNLQLPVLKKGGIQNLTKQVGNLQLTELLDAENYLIRRDQRETFQSEFEDVKNGTQQHVQGCCVIWDKDLNIIRIDGRIKGENVTRDEQYPILLAKTGDITELLIRDAHQKTLHGGNQLMMQYLRKRFWIIGCRQLLKNITRKCPKCFKLRMKTSEQLMASLPTKRTTPARAFTRVGVDYAGPVTLKTSILRQASLVKAYIAVFVCLVTRAVHLELVTDATTEAFIAAFRRMISRRGAVQEVLSDNGTNFVGANNYLQRLAKIINEKRSDIETDFQLQWTFITPNAPHHGGIYEAAVKSAKHHLVRVIGETSLTFEQYATVLCQTEACLNSRPLCALSDDPTTFNALTPGHFLIGEALVGIPDQHDFFETPTNRLNKYELMQKIMQHFWKRWKDDYLMTLINRPKWKNTNRNIQPGDLVVVKEDNLPPLKWKLARVVEVYPGDDGLVRSVQIKVVNIDTPHSKRDNLELRDFKTNFNFYKRPITKLGLLMSVEEQKHASEQSN